MACRGRTTSIVSTEQLRALIASTARSAVEEFVKRTTQVAESSRVSQQTVSTLHSYTRVRELVTSKHESEDRSLFSVFCIAAACFDADLPFGLAQLLRSSGSG